MVHGGIQVRYRKGPLSQKSAHAETKTNTNPSPDPNRYRRRCPDPIMLGYRSLYMTWQ